MREHGPIADLVGHRGWRVTLPSELEWEKAARGGLRDRVFSWGDDPDPNRANYDGADIDDTSAVGCFPANGFALYDMLGNLFEWTRSRYRDYPYRAGDGRERAKPGGGAWMVVCGGSWLYYRYLARCAFRYYLIGFRVVVGSAPVRRR